MARDRRYLVLLTVGVGSFMSALDSSIVNSVLPVIEHSLGGGVAGIEWVVTIYLLVVSGLLLTIGRVGDLYGHRAVYLRGFAGFVLGSALCGAAPTRAALIAARGLQGIGAAMLYANSPAILTLTFPGEQRGRALGLQALMTYLGLTVGPPLGGWITAAWSWRAVFYINVPVGALAVALGARVIARDRPSGKVDRFDLAGATAFSAGLVVLLLAIDRARAWGVTSPAVLGGGALGLVLLAVFVAVERRARAPMLDLGLFASRRFSTTTACALLNYVSLFTVVFVVPFFLLRARGLSTTRTGLLLSSQSLAMAIVAPISGWASDRIGTRGPAAAGLAILAAGLALAALWALPAGSDGSMAVALATCGLGTGMFISPNNSALMGAAPRQRQGIAAGMLAEARNVGMVLGVAIAGAILGAIAAAHPGPAGIVAGARAALLVGAAASAAGSILALLG